MSPDGGQSSEISPGRPRPVLAGCGCEPCLSPRCLPQCRPHGTRAALERDGIATAIHYPLAISQQPAYRDLTHASCPQAEGWAAECISVPCFPEMTEAEVDRVCTALAGLVE